MSDAPDNDYGLGLKVHEDAYRELERELATVAEQRDEARAVLVYEQGGIHATAGGWAAKYAEAIEQRDRLAEALREIKNELGVPQPEYPAPVANAVRIAEQALAAVEGVSNE
jgi:hypothetical protein